MMRKYKVVNEDSAFENINKIIYNDAVHIVAVFKEYLIYDDVREIISWIYDTRRSKNILKKLITKPDKNPVTLTYLFSTNKSIKKANLKKQKIRRIKEEDRQRDRKSVV